MTKQLPLPVSHCATFPLPLPPRAADFSLEGGFGESFLLQEGYGTAGQGFLFLFGSKNHDAAVGDFSSFSLWEWGSH